MKIESRIIVVTSSGVHMLSSSISNFSQILFTDIRDNINSENVSLLNVERIYVEILVNEQVVHTQDVAIAQ